MIAIYYDDDCDALWMTYRKEPFLPGTLKAIVKGDWIIVTRCVGDEAVLTVLYDQITRSPTDTIGFSSAQECYNYLSQEFLKHRPLGNIFLQATPATVWTITHGLSFQPKALVIDTAGDPVLTDIRYLTSSTLELRFGAPTAGTAYLS